MSKKEKIKIDIKQNRGVVNDRNYRGNVCVANAFCVCFDDCKNAR